MVLHSYTHFETKRGSAPGLPKNPPPKWDGTYDRVPVDNDFMISLHEHQKEKEKIQQAQQSKKK